MNIKNLAISEVKLILPKIFRDERGFFSETYNQSAALAGGLDGEFVQDNHVLSRQAGVVRGLHFQIGATAQGKLIRVTKGSILDVAVDIRVGSPSFGRSVTQVLSAENWQQLWVPIGFAHGYCTLEPDTEVIYKVTAFYDPDSERGIQFDDPALEIQWPVSRAEAILSSKDAENLPMSAHPEYFRYKHTPEGIA